MGVFDQINAALTGQKPAQPKGTTSGTTSGLDAAMQAHADQVHPTTTAGAQQKNSGSVATKTRKDGSLILMGDPDYGK